MFVLSVFVVFKSFRHLRIIFMLESYVPVVRCTRGYGNRGSCENAGEHSPGLPLDARPGAAKALIPHAYAPRRPRVFTRP